MDTPVCDMLLPVIVNRNSPASSGIVSIVPFSFHTLFARHWLFEPLGRAMPASLATVRVSCAQSKQGLPSHLGP